MRVCQFRHQTPFDVDRDSNPDGCSPLRPKRSSRISRYCFRWCNLVIFYKTTKLFNDIFLDFLHHLHLGDSIGFLLLGRDVSGFDLALTHSVEGIEEVLYKFLVEN